MGNIAIKEILAADTVSDLVDKINFNFDQLLLNGGGPLGMTGTAGPLGPSGPRGSLWFTLHDIYNTDLTTLTSPGYYFPIWNSLIGPERVNIETNPGFPQWHGDPNRYRPVATTASPNTYPQWSFTIGTTGKIPRSGDFYLQEGDDIFDGYNSYDGDIWEFNGVANTWTFTGANIKGAAGSTGSSGSSDWVRTTDGQPTANDILRPKVVAGRNQDVRLLLGIDDPTYVTKENSIDKYTDNTLTIYQDYGLAPDGYQISLTDYTSITSSQTGSPTTDYARIGTANNILYIEGFSDATNDQSNYGRDVLVLARHGNVFLESYNQSDNNFNTVQLSSYDRQLLVTNARLYVTVDPTFPENGNTPQPVMHQFDDGLVGLQIYHNQSSTIGGWASASIRMRTVGYAAAPNTSDLILQEGSNSTNNVGIGANWTTGRPSGKLSIGRGYSNGSSIIQSALVIGNTWADSVNSPLPRLQTVSGTSSSFQDSQMRNSAFIQGGLVVATGSGDPVMYGQSAITSVGNISLPGANVIAFNSYIDRVTSGGVFSYRIANTGTVPYFIGSANSQLYSVSGAQTSDLNNRFIIGGGSSSSIANNALVTGSLQGSQPYNVNIIIDSTTSKVGINTINLQTSLNSYGGAIIGKAARYSTDGEVFHIDSQSNKNIILGHPLNSTISTHSSPYIDVSDKTLSTSNSIYMTTPSWSSSLIFAPISGSTGTSDENVATTASYSSVFTAVGGSYQRAGSLMSSYYPSYQSQHKIIHGYRLDTRHDGFGGRLEKEYNPYDTGIGLEINTVQYTNTTGYSYEKIWRSPVIRRTVSGQYVYNKGNRPILITRAAENNNTIYDRLFEVTPFGNTAIGTAFSYPVLSTWDVNYAVPTASATPSLTVLRPDQAAGKSLTARLPEGDVSLSNNSNTGSWLDTMWAMRKDTSTNTPGYDIVNFILPSADRSLHISSIGGVNGETGFNDQVSVDQNRQSIMAGILIDTTPFYLTGTLNATASVSNILGAQYYNRLTTFRGEFYNNDYDYDNYGFYRPQITTPMKSAVTMNQATGRYLLATAAPFSIKPGLFSYNFNGNYSAASALNIKGVDLMLSSGDVYYNEIPINTVKPGDVFVYGGTVYKDAIGGKTGVSGYQTAITNINAQSWPTQEKRNIGNIYIGSRPDTDDYNGYTTTTGIVKSGLVYVGYESTQSSVWNSSATSFTPKGKAALNVAAVPDNSLREADGLKSGGRAINIQQGDIVTNDEQAGWVTLNLVTGAGFVSGLQSFPSFTINPPIGPPITVPGFDAGTSNILFTSTEAFPSAALAPVRYSTVNYVTPRWIAKYKVVGYTVFFKLYFWSVLADTLLTPNPANSIFGDLAINLGALMPSLNSGSFSQSGGMPPLLRTNESSTSVYPSNQAAIIIDRSRNMQPFFNEPSSTLNFVKGTVILRNSRYDVSTVIGGAGTYPLTAASIATVSSLAGGNSYNLPIETIPVTASYSRNARNSGYSLTGNTGDLLLIRKTGASTFTYGWHDTNDAGRFAKHSNYAFAFLPIRGWYLDGQRINTGQNGINALQFDLVLEGTYELDPAKYFN